MAVVQGTEIGDSIVDAGESAKNLERPEMERILRLVQTGEVDRVIAAKLDRLSRSVRDLADLLEIFQRKCVSLVSVAESVGYRLHCRAARLKSDDRCLPMGARGHRRANPGRTSAQAVPPGVSWKCTARVPARRRPEACRARPPRAIRSQADSGGCEELLRLTCGSIAKGSVVGQVRSAAYRATDHGLRRFARRAASGFFCPSRKRIADLPRCGRPELVSPPGGESR